MGPLKNKSPDLMPSHSQRTQEGIHQGEEGGRIPGRMYFLFRFLSKPRDCPIRVVWLCFAGLAYVSVTSHQ